MRGGGRGLWAVEILTLGAKLTSSLWGILLYLVGLSPNGVGTSELGMRSEPANRLRVMKESQLPREELE